MSASTIDDAALAAPTFADLGVPAPMAGAMARRGITSPFPIQAATIPDAIAGRDLCGRAPTGSGKTIAFGIPLVLGVGKAKSRRPRGLVLVPTRELASQVCHELQQLAKPKGPWVEAFYGGVGFPKQVQALQRGVDIAVACPGRLADLINQGCADLRDVDFVVVDEADRMADMGFLPEVRRLLDQCSDDRQTLLFSATLDGDVDVLIKRYQRDPVRHELHGDDEDASRATHLFWQTERSDRLSTAAALVSRAGPTVVFCRTKRGADRVARQLEAAGVPAAAIHGDRSQAQRERALRSFHKGEVQALVATDVAARGIHVDDVACVVHFDPPQESKDYVHRSGRTARAGASGLVVTLVLADLRKDVKRLQRELGYPVRLEPADLESIPQSERAHTKPKRPRSDDRDGARTDAKHRPARSQQARGPRTRDDAAKTRASRHNSTVKPSERTRQRDQGKATSRAYEAPSAAPKKHPGAGGAELEPLPEGKRRPSGAARRKAKRLAAVELDATDRPRPSRPGGRTTDKRASAKPRSGGSAKRGNARKHGPSASKNKAGGAGPRRTGRPSSSKRPR